MSAGQRAQGSGTPIASEQLRVHSHLKLLIPGNGKIRPGQTFPLPENPGPHAKSPT